MKKHRERKHAFLDLKVTWLSRVFNQGSILGPILFAINLLPLGQIFRKYILAFNCFADYIQNYLPVKPDSKDFLQSLPSCLTGRFKIMDGFQLFKTKWQDRLISLGNHPNYLTVLPWLKLFTLFIHSFILVIKPSFLYLFSRGIIIPLGVCGWVYGCSNIILKSSIKMTTD